MGLDIVAISNAKYFAPDFEDESELENRWWVADPDGFDRLDGRPEGLYDGEAECGFRAGSYSGYGHWRWWLSTSFLGIEPQVVWSNPPKFDGLPFVELIYFSDCNGAIGPVTSAKLAGDFRNHLDRLPPIPPEPEPDQALKEFRDLYSRMGRGEALEPADREKLAQGFRARLPLESEADIAEWNREQYHKWLEAFEVAAKDGFVIFG